MITADSSVDQLDDLNDYFYQPEKNAILYKEKFEFERESRLDDFKIMSLIGQGGFGKVFLVHNEKDGKFYAMKQIRKDIMIKKNTIESTKLEK